MTRVWHAAALAAASASAASAGGIDRSGQGVNILFEDGNYAQVTFSHVSPDVNGSAPSVVPALGPSTDVAQSYNYGSFGYKHALSDRVDVAVIVDQPFGAHIYYQDGPFSLLPAGNGTADIDSHAVTGLVQYGFGNGFSIHGGFRALTVDGIITSSPGTLQASSDYDFGYVVGASYEKPEIALRVALTYSSAITSGLSGTRTNGGVTQEVFDVEFPESVNLDLQTGIAEDTLLFGSIRWVGWNGFNLTTSGSTQWVNFEGDTTTYEIGVGRRINDKLSLALSLGYEEPGVRPSTTALAPTTGSSSIGIGGTYQLTEAMTISGGVRYIVPGDQVVNAGGAGTIDFDDNSAVAVGVRIGYQF